MRNKTALFVSKDLGSANMLLPIAEKWQSHGGESKVIAEGLAGKKFLEAGFKPYFLGTDNFMSVPFTLDTQSALSALAPHIVIVGESAPINLERSFAEAARSLSLPLVVVDDLWGGFKRVGVTPDLVLTLDDLGVQMVKKHLPNHCKFEIVGNPGVPSDEKINFLRQKMPDIRGKLPSGKIIGYIGGGKDSAEEELGLLVQSLDITPGDWTLVVAFHPKWKNQLSPNGVPYGLEWNLVLSEVKNVCYSQDLNLSSEDVVTASDMVVAGISTLMSTAAKLGKPVISLSTPKVLNALRSEANLEEVPQVSLGIAQKVTAPVNLLSDEVAHQNNAHSLKSFDPELAYTAIKSFLRH